MWLRQDLRVHDNPALTEAARWTARQGGCVTFVYVHSPEEDGSEVGSSGDDAQDCRWVLVLLLLVRFVYVSVGCSNTNSVVVCQVAPSFCNVFTTAGRQLVLLILLLQPCVLCPTHVALPQLHPADSNHLCTLPLTPDAPFLFVTSKQLAARRCVAAVGRCCAAVVVSRPEVALRRWGRHCVQAGPLRCCAARCKGNSVIGACM
jgi:hypothetical protein